jgi:Mn-containing catalase
MFFHNKALIEPVSVGKPDARFGTYLLEQFGGATGELTAALCQSSRSQDKGIRRGQEDRGSQSATSLSTPTAAF